MEIALVRKELVHAIEAARRGAAARRQQVHDAQEAYDRFLTDIAVPLVRQVANVMKAEGFGFLVHTPSGGLRLASERSRDDYLDFALDTDSTPPQVTVFISRGRGSRTITVERPVKSGAAVAEITEDELLAFLIDVLGPWIER